MTANAVREYERLRLGRAGRVGVAVGVTVTEGDGDVVGTSETDTDGVGDPVGDCVGEVAVWVVDGGVGAAMVGAVWPQPVSSRAAAAPATTTDPLKRRILGSFRWGRYGRFRLCPVDPKAHGIPAGPRGVHHEPIRCWSGTEGRRG
ncbi:MAG: hypothetical protein KIT69_02210 [Propionibacteriaceae bacterium]|nr:hypothetical protein [Propionibacteriaceae bacterium]